MAGASPRLAVGDGGEVFPGTGFGGIAAAAAAVGVGVVPLLLLLVVVVAMVVWLELLVLVLVVVLVLTSGLGSFYKTLGAGGALYYGVPAHSEQPPPLLTGVSFAPQFLQNRPSQTALLGPSTYGAGALNPLRKYPTPCLASIPVPPKTSKITFFYYFLTRSSSCLCQPFGGVGGGGVGGRVGRGGGVARHQINASPTLGAIPLPPRTVHHTRKKNKAQSSCRLMGGGQHCHHIVPGGGQDENGHKTSGA